MRKIEKFLIVMVWLGLMSCSSEYDQTVRRELRSGVVNDSLFLGFKFNDSREEFFSKGWELNKKNLVAQGPKNQNIQYLMGVPEQGKSVIQMLFYPDFDKDMKVRKMDISYSYMGWSPWNRKFFSDSLMVAVKDSLMTWYGGNEFLPILKDNQTTDTIWAKVDGNRLITLTIADDKMIKGYIKNLIHPDFKK